MTHVVVGTAGHIDHGKSALVLALTGTDPDRLKEEKARGITIDLGFAHTQEGDVVLSFVDVPGHERFVRNMLAGAGGMDLVMLHVAADESVMPQTREHLDICRLLHVPAGLIVLTKADLVDADTLDVVRLEVQELVARSFLEGAPIVAVSARTGAGLPELRRTLAALAAEARTRPSFGPPRLPVDRVFSMRGFGTVVTGTLVSGVIRADDELELLPSGRAVKVRGLQVHGAQRDAAAAGQRVAVNLAGVEVGDVARGEALTTRDAATVTRRVDVALELLDDRRPLRSGTQVRFHQGTSDLLATVSLAADPAFARLHLERPACLARGDRFVLRIASPAATIGGGTVLDPLPPRRGVRSEAAARRFERLAGSTANAVLAMIEEAQLAGLPYAQLTARAGVAWHLREDVCAELERHGAVRIGDALVASAVLADAERRLLAAVREHHAAHALEEGMPREELRGRIVRRSTGAADAAFERVLASLARRGELIARDRIALRGHSLALTDEEARAREAMTALLDQSALAPPDRAELASRIGASPDVIDRVAHLLVRQKVAVRLGDLLFHEAALRRLKDEIRSLKPGIETIDVATFKDRYQVSRKYAIPLLEFLDRERVTRRVGDARKIL